MKINVFNSDSAHFTMDLTDSNRVIPFQGAILNVEEISVPGYLDLEGFNVYFLRASHVVITNGDKLRPMPLNGTNTAYAALPSGYEYFGVLYQATPTAQPLCIAMTKGALKESLSPYPLTPAIKSALTGITFS